MVIDGEHRAKILIKNNIQFVYCKIFEVSYAEVRFMRQIANKLSGIHDKKKDADEYFAIYESNNLEEFARTLGKPLEDFERILERNFEIDFETIKQVIKWLEIKVEIIKESELGVKSESTQRLIDVCKKLGADTYVSGPGGHLAD